MKILAKKRLLIGLTLLNLAFIFGNSLLPAEVSAAISGSVKSFLALLFPADGFAAENAGHSLLRKIAHFAEFACLGLLLTWLRGMNRKKLTAIFPVLGGLTVALVDETIQGFVPGRTPMVTDVLIDAAGAFFGMLVLLGGYHLYKRIKSKHLNILEETT